MRRVVVGAALAAMVAGASTARASVNLIVNGDFSQGLTGFASGYVNNQTNLHMSQTYAVTTDPRLVKSNWGNFKAPGGFGDMLAVNGGHDRNLAFWGEDVKVKTNTDYSFTMWMASNSKKKPAVLELKIDGLKDGGYFKATKKVGKWIEYTATWNSGSNTMADLDLYDMNTRGKGNDFSITDLFFGCSTTCAVPTGPTGPTTPGGVPEPSTWTMLILGLGAVGIAARRRTARFA